MNEAKELILCADDFAQDAATTSGILSLVRKQRLSAVSCFTDSPLWPTAGGTLCADAGGVLLGLHFNLSHDFGFGERPLGHWIRRSALGALERAPLREALERQIDRFTSITGRLPDYIDGHHHVHAFPVIRDVVDETAASAAGRPIPVRDVSRPIGATDAPLKRLAIRRLAALRRRPMRAPALNASFAGDYSLSPGARFDALFADWLSGSAPGGLIMCHPRRAEPGETPLAGDAELAFLASAAFEEALAAHRCRLLRAPLANRAGRAPGSGRAANDSGASARPTA